jgi:hypothetical protein
LHIYFLYDKIYIIKNKNKNMSDTTKNTDILMELDIQNEIDKLKSESSTKEVNS